MRIDPKLLKRLESLDNPNQVLADALGLCPTCGQPLPEAERKRPGDKRMTILEWREAHPGETQSACARALGVSQTYVGRVWQDADEDANPPRGDGDV